jgi:transcriptional regulator with XRE-family HTH domain
MNDIREFLGDDVKDAALRQEYAEEFLNSYIALQIKTLRQQRGWSQEELAARAGMKQSRISAMEQADYSSWSVRTLRRLAQAFDLALSVSFESFGKFFRENTVVARAALERPSFDEDRFFNAPTVPAREDSSGDALGVVSLPLRPLNRMPQIVRVASRG